MTQTPIPARDARGVATLDQEPPPVAKMLDLISGMMSARAVQVAADLGIADYLTARPKRADELAALTGSDPVALHRLLRYLASIGVFVELDGGAFGHTPLSRLLRSGPNAPDSLRDLARMWGDRWMCNAWGDLGHSMRTGRPAVDEQVGENLFEYFAHQDPEAGLLFSRSMTSFSSAVDGPVVDAYDFGGCRRVVDVGGAHGSLLAAILAAHPGPRGVLFDQPQVVADAANGPLSGHAARCQMVGGDFFDAVPPGADTYVLKMILHDWSDEACVTLLRNCREAMARDARVLVIEQVIPEGNTPSFGKLLDLAMLVCLGGRERTAQEYAGLFEAAGLHLAQVVPTHSLFSILEGAAGL
jgi:O-methyltransferase domain